MVVLLSVILAIIFIWLAFKYFVYFDYVLIAVMTWYYTSQHLELHNAYILVLVIFSVILWRFISNRRLFGVKVFGVLGGLFAAAFITYLFVTEAPLDLEWRIVIGCVIFIAIFAIRVNKGDLFK